LHKTAKATQMRIWKLILKLYKKHFAQISIKAFCTKQQKGKPLKNPKSKSKSFKYIVCTLQQTDLRPAAHPYGKALRPLDRQVGVLRPASQL